MKAEVYNLVNYDIKKNLISRIMDLECDGKISVTIANIGSKSKRQQSLDWRWDGEIFKSGIGWGDKTIDLVHARSKWFFAKPILLRDDDIFPGIYTHFMDTYGHDEEKCIQFAKNYISTQNMSVSQVAEYLTNKQLYWTDRGVNLTDPSLQGLKL